MSHPVKSDLIAELLDAIDKFCAASGRGRTAVSKILFGRGGQIDALVSGERDIATATYERAMAWLSANWPDGAARPEKFGEGAPAKTPPPLTPPHKGEGVASASESPSPLRGGVRGGGASDLEAAE